MSRAPVDIENPGQTRQAIWAAVRQLDLYYPTFTAAQVHGALPGATPRSRVYDYLAGLCAGGYLARVPMQGADRRVVYYRLERDAGIEAPRVTKGGGSVTHGRAREALWTALRVLRAPMGVRELIAHASGLDLVVTKANALDYLRWLTRGGYCAKQVRPDRTGLYLLVRNTGPLPPQVQRSKQLWDPNTRQVVVCDGDQEREAGHE